MMTAQNVISSPRKRNVSFSGKLFLNRELCDNIYYNQFILRRAWLSKVHFQLFLIISPFFLVNIRYILISVCFLSIFSFGVLRLTTVIYLLGDKNLEKVIISKITQIMHFFFLGNKVDFLSSDHMKLWASSPCSGMWTKQKQTLERESSKFMAVSTCSVCQYLWCHNQIKTIPSAIYISTVLRLHKFMSRLLSRFKTIQMFRTLKNQTIYFHIHFIFSLRERKLSSLIFLLKSARMRRETFRGVKTSFVLPYAMHSGSCTLNSQYPCWGELRVSATESEHGLLLRQMGNSQSFISGVLLTLQENLTCFEKNRHTYFG